MDFADRLRNKKGRIVRTEQYPDGSNHPSGAKEEPEDEVEALQWIEQVSAELPEEPEDGWFSIPNEA